ncbi:MAG: hypothetical protein COB35_03390 [Gammaproteobacteria bacterium]|nr:MAG: hypothetical protein COB35_03390 [Gammaproteobacteria bacterium]
MNKALIYLSFSLSLITLLSACGGSTTSSPSTPPPSPTPPTKNILMNIDANLLGQQATELVIFAPDEQITNISWQQTSGTNVNFLAGNSKVIAFTPQGAGDYSFQVNYSANGSAKTLTKTVTVADGNNLISVRLGHAALEGNKVSLRAWLDHSIKDATVTWQQTSGPTVNLTNYTNGDLAIFFTAPSVNKDTVIQFQASVNDGSANHTDSVAVLIENTDNIKSNAYFDSRLAKVFPYVKNSIYSNNLVNCFYSNNLTSSCTLSLTPLIAQQTTSPSVDDIMARVVVSHQWMGDRFKEFLINFDTNNDFKNLLRATTGIVISYDVRPSFYWAATGAIYLDASNFWLTPDERDTINEAPDYRSAFGKELRFVMPWRYVKNNNYASRSVPSTERVTRTGQDGLYRLASLLFHELAHANDFFPSSEWFSHNNNSRVLDAAQATNFESDGLASNYPLQNNIMRSLAQVSFAGSSANSSQKAYLPADISNFFSPDIATDYYNYSSLREDYAMLFEEVMMFTRYNIQRDVAVTNRPTGDVIFANDYIVDWGQRGRVGEASIKSRANFVLQRVLPELNNVNMINALPTPTAMISGNDWIENLDLSTNPSPSDTQQSKANKSTLNQQRLSAIENQRYFHKDLPKH